MSAAQRKRRQRQREKAGVVVVPVEVDEHQVTQVLIDRKLLREEDLSNRGAVAVALGLLVKDLTAQATFDARVITRPCHLRPNGTMALRDRPKEDPHG